MKPILVAGDAMLDRYWFGRVERISPEAPVPVVAVERVEERQGGAANVARNIEAMGVPVIECYSPSWATRAGRVEKLRVIAQQQQVTRIDFDRPQQPIDCERLLVLAHECEIAVLSDYGKGSLAGVAEIIAALKAKGKLVLVDPKGHKYERYRGADLVKPNRFEMRELVGPWDCEEELAAKIEIMRAGSDIEAVLLTLGAGGMTLYNGVRAHFPALVQDVFDVSGAGDTAIAAFAAASARGADMVQATNYANKAAGIAVGRFGTAIVRQEEVFQ